MKLWLRIGLAWIFSQYNFESLSSKAQQPGNKIWKTDGGMIHCWRLASWCNARLNIQEFLKWLLMSMSLESWVIFQKGKWSQRWFIDQEVQNPWVLPFYYWCSKYQIFIFSTSFDSRAQLHWIFLKLVL